MANIDLPLLNRRREDNCRCLKQFQLYSPLAPGLRPEPRYRVREFHNLGRKLYE